MNALIQLLFKLLILSALGTAPRIVISEGMIINLGEVPPDTAKTSFTIRNEGQDTLKIYNVLPGCDCTTFGIDSKMLAPGESTVVRIAIDLKNRHGKQRKPITLLTNDPVDSELTVSISAVVSRSIRVTPLSFPVVTNLELGHAFHTSISLENRNSDTVAFYAPQVRSKHGGLIYDFELKDSVKVPPGQIYSLKTTITGDKTGLHVDKVVIPSSLGSEEHLELEMSANVVLLRKE